MREMPYTIVFVTRNTHDVLAADATTAETPLRSLKLFQNRTGRFIRSSQEGEFGVEMLRLLAKEEEEEEEMRMP
jgi:hypothetical protein